MHRVYVRAGDIDGGRVLLSEEDSAHVARVLRLSAGEFILVCDGENREYDGCIISVEKKRVLVELAGQRAMRSEPNTKITLYQGMPKAGKLETIIQKGTEIGVHAFVPFYCERSVVKNRDKDDRCRRVAMEAAKQCGRGIVPEVSAPVTFEAMLKMLPRHELIIAPWEEERATGLKTLLKERAAADVAVIIGPEGGIAPSEMEALAGAGASAVTLGRRILRTETAGLVTAAAILYEYGDMQ